MNYSQNNEESIILDYFKDFTGTLLSIGENDGKTFSNALALIELGWSATLVEPSQAAFNKLEALHYDNDNVELWNVAIGGINGLMPFFDMGDHLGKGDTSLLSTVRESETKRWVGTPYSKTETAMWTVNHLFKHSINKTFDFITIDAEGEDYCILQQIDLSETKMVCIEHNNDLRLLNQMVRYCADSGLNKVITKNFENVLCGK